MSTTAPRPAAPPRPPGPARRPGGPGGGPFGMAMPGEKSMNFGPSAKRLLGRLRPDRARVALVLLLGVLSVGLSVLGPKLLGEATNIIFEGIVSAQLPAGATKAQVLQQLEASGNTQQADLIRNMTLDPGNGIHFDALRMVLGIVLLLYVFSSVFSYVQALILNGVTQRTVYRLRADVEDKLQRLPLSYFDRMP